MSKWKCVFIAAGASLFMYGCSADKTASSAAQTKDVQTSTEAAQTPGGVQAEAAQTSEGSQQAAAEAVSKELFENRNPSIGDASADGKLVDTVKKQLNITESSTIELQTGQEPYELELHFTEKPDQACMKRAAVVLLGLIDNCGIVSWDYPDSGGISATFSMDAKAAAQMIGVEDIKAYSQSPEKVNELLTHMNQAAEQTMEQEQESATGTKAATLKAQEPEYRGGG